MGTFSRKKGIRNELKLRDEFIAQGYESVRVPLSGAAAGHKGDVLFSKDGKTLKAECKARANSFKTLYQHIDSDGEKAFILDIDKSHLAVLSYTLQEVLEFDGSYISMPRNKKFMAVTRRLTNLKKLVGECDILAIKDDRKPFIYIRYL